MESMANNMEKRFYAIVSRDGDGDMEKILISKTFLSFQGDN